MYKNYFIIAALSLLAISGFSQGTLEFNQIRLITSSDGTVSVPTGKSWKIIGVLYSSQVPDPYCSSSSTCYSISAHNDIIVVNSANNTIRSVRSRGNGNSGFPTYLWEQEFPIWLPASATLATGTGVSSISVIEFNIVP
ncbi:MAG: hypothetical protein IT223_12425 [Crocinitomicaceae bacterium]|nr:hypothetical protein [Crocinitomicaceae bacterium]